jgi:hypothetical protein
MNTQRRFLKNFIQKTYSDSSLTQNGFSIHGGCLRDLIADKEFKDIDVFVDDFDTTIPHVIRIMRDLGVTAIRKHTKGGSIMDSTTINGLYQGELISVELAKDFNNTWDVNINELFLTKVRDKNKPFSEAIPVGIKNDFTDVEGHTLYVGTYGKSGCTLENTLADIRNYQFSVFNLYNMKIAARIEKMSNRGYTHSIDKNFNKAVMLDKPETQVMLDKPEARSTPSFLSGCLKEAGYQIAIEQVSRGVQSALVFALSGGDSSKVEFAKGVLESDFGKSLIQSMLFLIAYHIPMENEHLEKFTHNLLVSSIATSENALIDFASSKLQAVVKDSLGGLGGTEKRKAKRVRQGSTHSSETLQSDSEALDEAVLQASA